jgi:hypothetical protein
LPSAASADSLLIALLFVILVIEGRRSAARSQIQLQVIFCISKDWEIIADNLSKVDWSWGCVSAIDSNGRTIWVADAQRQATKRLASSRLSPRQARERAEREKARYRGGDPKAAHKGRRNWDSRPLPTFFVERYGFSTRIAKASVTRKVTASPCCN